MVPRHRIGNKDDLWITVRRGSIIRGMVEILATTIHCQLLVRGRDIRREIRAPYQLHIETVDNFIAGYPGLARTWARNPTSIYENSASHISGPADVASLQNTSSNHFGLFLATRFLCFAGSPLQAAVQMQAFDLLLLYPGPPVSVSNSRSIVQSLKMHTSQRK